MSNKMDMKIWSRLLNSYVKPNYRLIILSCIFMIVTAVSTAFTAQMMDPIVSKIFVMKDIGKLSNICLIVVCVFFIKTISTYLYSVTMGILETRITSELNMNLFESMIRLDISDITKLSTGKIMTYFNNDIRNVKEVLSTIIINFAKEFFTIIFLVSLMFWKSWELSLISLVVLPLAFYPLVKLSRKLRKVAKNSQFVTEKSNVHVQNVFDGISTIKAYCNEKNEIQKMSNLIKESKDLQIKSSVIGSVGSPMMEFMGGIAISFVIFYGGHKVINGITTAGSFFSFLAALLMLYKPVKSASNFGMILQNAYISLIRIFEVIDIKGKICSIQDANQKKIEFPDVEKIEMKGVNFSYREHSDGVLSDINISIKRGEKIAFVGHSGSGKSTIAKLLLRFYDVNNGSVEINDINIKDIDIKDLRKNISYVGQESFLFDDTIRSNICYGFENPTQEQIESATISANAKEFISKIPGGFDAKVGHFGNTLSVGQKQRIVIARAILKNSPIIILDEATSALDNKTEKEIQLALNELIKNKTTIIIAHRLSTISSCDRIFVVDDGKIVESGNHKELIENENSTYSKLWKASIL